MDKYTLTYEGRAIVRRMETRVHSDVSSVTEDYRIMHWLHEHGAATLPEIGDYTGLSANELTNKIFSIMNRGYIEKLIEH